MFEKGDIPQNNKEVENNNESSIEKYRTLIDTLMLQDEHPNRSEGVQGYIDNIMPLSKESPEMVEQELLAVYEDYVKALELENYPEHRRNAQFGVLVGDPHEAGPVRMHERKVRFNDTIEQSEYNKFVDSFADLEFDDIKKNMELLGHDEVVTSTHILEESFFSIFQNALEQINSDKLTKEDKYNILVGTRAFQAYASLLEKLDSNNETSREEINKRLVNLREIDNMAMDIIDILDKEVYAMSSYFENIDIDIEDENDSEEELRIYSEYLDYRDMRDNLLSNSNDFFDKQIHYTKASYASLINEGQEYILSDKEKVKEYQDRYGHLNSIIDIQLAKQEDIAQLDEWQSRLENMMSELDQGSRDGEIASLLSNISIYYIALKGESFANDFTYRRSHQRRKDSLDSLKDDALNLTRSIGFTAKKLQDDINKTQSLFDSADFELWLRRRK